MATSVNQTTGKVDPQWFVKVARRTGRSHTSDDVGEVAPRCIASTTRYQRILRSGREVALHQLVLDQELHLALPGFLINRRRTLARSLVAPSNVRHELRGVACGWLGLPVEASRVDRGAAGAHFADHAPDKLERGGGAVWQPVFEVVFGQCIRAQKSAPDSVSRRSKKNSRSVVAASLATLRAYLRADTAAIPLHIYENRRVEARTALPEASMLAGLLERAVLSRAPTRPMTFQHPKSPVIHKASYAPRSPSQGL